MQSRKINIMEVDYNNIDILLNDYNYIIEHYKKESKLKNLLNEYKELKDLFFREDFGGYDIDDFYKIHEEKHTLFKEELKEYRENYFNKFGYTADQLDDEDSDIYKKCEDFFLQAKDILGLEEEIYIFSEHQRKILEVNGLVVNENIVIEQ